MQKYYEKKKRQKENIKTSTLQKPNLTDINKSSKVTDTSMYVYNIILDQNRKNEIVQTNIMIKN